MTFRPFRAVTSTETEVNLTPLIDVSLVLVVMLLLATPLAFESSIAVQRGEHTGRQAAQESDRARIEVVVLDESAIRLNQKDVSLEDFGPRLVSLLEQAPGAPVVVRCEEGVSHGAFVAVIDEAKAHGATSIAVTRS